MNLVTKPIDTNGTKSIPCPHCGGRKVRHVIKSSGEIQVEQCGYCRVDGTVSTSLWKK